MWILGLDTATLAPSLALFQSEGAHSHVRASKPLPPASAEHLVASLSALLSGEDLGIEEIARIGVISGPGSFTGLRAGLAFSRGLSRALHIPLIAVPAFEAASTAFPGPGEVHFILEAGRGEVHYSRRNQDGVLTAPALVPRAEVRGEPVVEITQVSLAEAAARVATKESRTGLTPILLYGRVSAAEEKFGSPGEAG